MKIPGRRGFRPPAKKVSKSGFSNTRKWGATNPPWTKSRSRHTHSTRGGGGGSTRGGGGGGLPVLSASAVDSGTPSDLQSSITALTGGGGGYSRTPEQEAQDRLNPEYDSKINALKRALATANTEYGAREEGLKQFGSNYDQKLSQIYDQLRSQLHEGQRATGEQFDKSQQSIQQIFAGLTGANQQAGGAVQGELAANAKSLGLEAGLADPAKRLQETMNLLQTQAASNKAGAETYLAQNKQAAQQFGQGNVDSAAFEGSTARTDLAKEVASGLANLSLERLQSTNNISAQEADLHGERAAAIRQMTEDIKQARSEAERQAVMDDFAMKIQQNTIDLQRAKLGLQASNQDFDNSLAAQKFAFDVGDKTADNARAEAALGIKVRGQDLAHQRGMLSATKTATKKKTSLNPLQKRTKQHEIVKSVKKNASRGTQEAFNLIIANAPTYQRALAYLRDTPDKELKKNGVSRKSLEDWVRRYYYYK